jgi:hypothetical protein
LNFETLGNIGEFVGAVAVVASLIYLATQMRQNSLLVRASAYQTASDWTLAALTQIAGNTETARIFSQGLVDPRELTDAERTQFSTLMNIIFTGLATQFLNHRRGVLPADQWTGMEQIAIWYMDQSGVQRWLNGPGNRVNPEFLSHIRKCQESQESAV